MEIRVGDKIKQSRKELKMSQAALGGEHISKGMLSLIENNLATPSMKSLQYIAERLNKPVSYFLDDNYIDNQIDDTSEINQILMQTNALISRSIYMTPTNILAEMNRIIKHFSKPYKIFHANIFNQFGLTLTSNLQFNDSDHYFKNALEIYMKNNMILDTSKVYLNMHFNYYFQYEFIKCKDALDLASESYSNSISKDNIHEINLLYHKADLLCLTHSDYNQAVRTIDSAIELSLESNMYFLERLYRMKALLFAENQEFLEFKNNIEKSMMLCKASNLYTQILVLNATATGENALGDSKLAFKCLQEAQILFVDLFKIQTNPQDDASFINEVIQILSIQSNNLDSEQHSKAFYTWLIEKAVSLHRLNQNEQSLAFLDSIDFDFFVSRFVLIPDKAFFWRERITQAMLLNKCGKLDEAFRIAFLARDHLLDINSYYDLYKSYECLSEIYNSVGDYENAYLALQSAHKYLKENVNYTFKI